MNDKIKSKIVRKILISYSIKSEESYWIDMKLDGSGELGSVIRINSLKSDRKYIFKLCEYFDLKIETFLNYLNQFTIEETKYSRLEYPTLMESLNMWVQETLFFDNYPNLI